MDSSISPTSNTDPPEHFRFFDLPTELRLKILGMVLHTGQTLDIEYYNTRRSAILPVSKQFRTEASDVFYGGNTFRLLPTHGRAGSNKFQPLITRFSPRNRALLQSVELRLGPFWTNPPKCWKVDDRLGLEDVTSLRVLKVFVECDPSHSIFNGFRSARDYYTNFSGEILREIIRRLPNLQEVVLDGYPSVWKGGLLMKRLVEEIVNGQKKLIWGPGQALYDDTDNFDEVPWVTKQ